MIENQEKETSSKPQMRNFGEMKRLRIEQKILWKIGFLNQNLKDPAQYFDLKCEEKIEIKGRDPENASFVWNVISVEKQAPTRAGHHLVYV